MSLGGDIADRREAEQRSKEPQRNVAWDAETGQGVIQTGRVFGDFNPNDLGEVLRYHGLDPERWRITGHVGFTEWDVPFRNADGQREFHKAQSHRFTFEQRGFEIDLPALYAEVAKAHTRDTLKPRTGDATVVVCWADIQVGKVDELGGMVELLTRLDEKRDALDAYLRRVKYDHIVVADCGDIIEGFGNFPAQHRTNALSLEAQIDVASTEFWKTLRLCERHAPIDVLCCPSNHCAWRKGGKALAGKTTDDWGLHINKRLERMNDEVGLRIGFHRPADWCETMQFDIRGTRMGLAHGHQVSNPDQVKAWWAKMTHAGVLDCNILLTGHFHFPSLRPVGKDPTGRSRWHIQAPTLDNGSAWVRNKYGEDGDPALCVFQVNDEGFDVQSFALL